MPQKPDGFDGAFHNKVRKVLMYGDGTGTATKGDVAMIDPSTTTNGIGNHVLQGVQADGALACGVFDETKTAREMARGVQVQVTGRRTDINVATSTAAKRKLVLSSTNGRAADLESLAPGSDTYVTATMQLALRQSVFAISLTAESSNALTATIIDPHQLAE